MKLILIHYFLLLAGIIIIIHSVINKNDDDVIHRLNTTTTTTIITTTLTTIITTLSSPVAPVIQHSSSSSRDNNDKVVIINNDKENTIIASTSSTNTNNNNGNLTYHLYKNAALSGIPSNIGTIRITNNKEIVFELSSSNDSNNDCHLSGELLGSIVFPFSPSGYEFDCTFVHTSTAFVWIDGHVICNDGNTFRTTKEQLKSNNPFFVRRKQRKYPFRVHITSNDTNACHYNNRVTTFMKISYKQKKKKNGYILQNNNSTITDVIDNYNDDEIIQFLPKSPTKSEERRDELQRNLTSIGWGNWLRTNMISLVKLPEGLVLNIVLCYNEDRGLNCLTKAIPDDTSTIRVGMHTYDHSYVAYNITHPNQQMKVSIEYGVFDGELQHLITVLECNDNCSNFMIGYQARYAWFRPGVVEYNQNYIRYTTPGFDHDQITMKIIYEVDGENNNNERKEPILVEYDYCSELNNTDDGEKEETILPNQEQPIFLRRITNNEEKQKEKSASQFRRIYDNNNNNSEQQKPVLLVLYDTIKFKKGSRIGLITETSMSKINNEEKQNNTTGSSSKEVQRLLFQSNNNNNKNLSSSAVQQIYDNLKYAQRKEERRLQEKFGIDRAEVANAIQCAIMWTCIYNPIENNALFMPVSRSSAWDFTAQSHATTKDWVYTLFEWDNFFASLLAGLDNKELAYSNLFQTVKSITSEGFIPNWSSGGSKSQDRTEPPIGAKVVVELYRKYKEIWPIEVVFDDLLSWNNWFIQHRVLQPLGLIALGSCYRDDTTTSGTIEDRTRNTLQGAKYESGLDNSPMYDNAVFDANRTHLMQMYDVGMTSLFIQEAYSLAELAKIIGRPTELIKMLQRRGDRMKAKLIDNLWDSQRNIYANRYTNNTFVSHITPTSFYPLAIIYDDKDDHETRTASMIQNWLTNSSRFCISSSKSLSCYWGLPSVSADDPTYLIPKEFVYWRGYTWAPMAQIVYWSLQQQPQHYHLNTKENNNSSNNNIATKIIKTKARKALCQQMKDLMLDVWKSHRHVCENYYPNNNNNNDCSGTKFYHWGALNGLITMMEDGCYY